MTKKDKKNFLLSIPLIFMMVTTGCVQKNIEVEPTVSYGNPAYQHIKDLPQIQHKKESVPQDYKIFNFNADDYEKLGDAFFLGGKYRMAVQQYKKSLSLNDDNLRVTYKSGVASLAAKDAAYAKKQFDKIIKKDKKYALAYEGLGRLYLKQKQLILSKKYFETAIELNPLLWRAYSYLGNISDLSRDHNQAIDYYRTALSIEPTAGYIYNNIGLSYYSLTRYEDAVRAYYKALELNYTDNRVYNNLGRALTQLNFFEKALEAYLKGGEEAVAYNNIGVGYLEKGMIDEASQSFKKAIALNPHFYRTANENLKKCMAIKGQLNIKEKKNDM